ncbi:hypothetical protein PCE1_003290 [Barthelona sp. PCE]
MSNVPRNIQGRRQFEDNARFFNSVNAEDRNLRFVADWENKGIELEKRAAVQREYNRLKEQEEMNLELRRKKLANLIEQEKNTWMEAISAQQTSPEERFEELKHRAEILKRENIEHDRREAEKLRYVAWKDGCDEFRQDRSKVMALEIDAMRRLQEVEKQVDDVHRAQLESYLEQVMEEDYRRKVERDEADHRRQVELRDELRHNLLKQQHDNNARRQEEKRLEMEIERRVAEHQQRKWDEQDARDIANLRAELEAYYDTDRYARALAEYRKAEAEKERQQDLAYVQQQTQEYEEHLENERRQKEFKRRFAMWNHEQNALLRQREKENDEEMESLLKAFNDEEDRKQQLKKQREEDARRQLQRECLDWCGERLEQEYQHKQYEKQREYDYYMHIKQQEQEFKDQQNQEHMQRQEQERLYKIDLQKQVDEKNRIKAFEKEQEQLEYQLEQQKRQLEERKLQFERDLQQQRLQQAQQTVINADREAQMLTQQNKNLLSTRPW